MTNHQALLFFEIETRRWFNEVMLRTGRNLPKLLASVRIWFSNGPLSNMTLLDELNLGQREAATAIEGPVLILAGAGTGKTRAITYRIAHLIEQRVPGNAILAVTFTNKAAGQMKERVRDLLIRKGLAFDDPWIGTFHSFCAWLLRREAPRLGLPRDFRIYDADDQCAVVKLALEQLNIKDPGERVRGLLERISFAKNHGDDSRAGRERCRETQ